MNYLDQKRKRYGPITEACRADPELKSGSVANQKRPTKRQNWAWPSAKTLLSNVSSIHLQNLASIGLCY